jgi:hypothetical protein
VNPKHCAGTVSPIVDRLHRSLIARGAAALVVGALALTAARVGDRALQPAAPRAGATASAVGRTHAPPAPPPVGVVAALGLAFAALVWGRTTVRRPGDIPTRPASPIQRRGPPLRR